MITNIRQIITGFGLGLVLQGPNIAAQTVLPSSETSIGLSVLQFGSFLGGTVFVTVSQTILENQLVKGLAGIMPDLDPSTIANGGATSLRNMVSSEELPVVLGVYNDSMKSIWYLGLALACWVFLASFGMEWRSVRKEKSKPDSV